MSVQNSLDLKSDPRAIVGTREYGAPAQFRQTITFADLGGRTRISWRGDFPSAAERDRVIEEYGADTGLVQTMARLADFVAKQS